MRETKGLTSGVGEGRRPRSGGERGEKGGESCRTRNHKTPIIIRPCGLRRRDNGKEAGERGGIRKEVRESPEGKPVINQGDSIVSISRSLECWQRAATGVGGKSN